MFKNGVTPLNTQKLRRWHCFRSTSPWSYYAPN